MYRAVEFNTHTAIAVTDTANVLLLLTGMNNYRIPILIDYC